MRTHALAFGAILDSQNGHPHSRLLPEMTPAQREEYVRRERELLGTSWDVHSREDLLDMLEKLQSGDFGQRRSFWDLRQRLLEGRTENYLKLINEAQARDQSGARAFFVATHLGPFHGRTLPITSWDFGRYINLCRWGVLSEWLTEQEAWERILPAARLLQASYASWDDFSADYFMGRNFWRQQSGAENDAVRYTVAILKNPPNGLWSTIPWSESLGEGKVLQDTLATKLLDHYSDPDPNRVSLDHLPNQNPLEVVIRASVDSK